MQRRRLLTFAALLVAPALMAAAPAKDEKKKGGGASFIQINTLTATVIRASGRRGILTVESGLDIPNEKLRAKANSVLPRIRAAFVQALQIYASGMSPGAIPNAEILTLLLQREADQVLGQKGARLLLGTMLIN
ncbi:MAG: Tat pathway signal protein [Pseudomonadota bacterium]|uniref:Tat pathway signal protein n=1 Tax=Phenylobacterium sp. TaxID=1871053 RepID=UPI0025FE1349|nr:Tat pathway signal protein [Phenylobacterium sp.]MBT9470959.1 Tat pathway signal protein [Phenylobacterium sp.]